jgi:hypothetical protein
VTEKVTNLADQTEVSSSSIVSHVVPTAKWVSDVLNQMADWLHGREFVNPDAFIRALDFLSSVRAPVRRPFVALGDDGSIGIEWDRAGQSLHVSFSSYGDEFYWSRGDDWETDGPLPGNESVVLLAIHDSALL